LFEDATGALGALVSSGERAVRGIGGWGQECG